MREERKKLIGRIIRHCSLYSSDLNYLNKLQLTKLRELYFSLFIPLIIKQRYRLRHKLKKQNST